MNESYEETLEGQRWVRRAPGARHELICARLHERIAVAVAGLATSRLLPARTLISLAAGNSVRPDLALVTAATGKLWLAAEVVSADDHHADTVAKKQIYETFRLPRLWMIDPRYDNVEIYHATEYGLALKEILAGTETISEKLLPGFRIGVAELFAAPH